MGLFDHFPYTNFHEMNLDWILQVLKEIEKTMDQFVAINSLKYADPIQWNIVRQYEKNTIVIDPLTGVAYISVQAVPSGVALTNTDYWTVVFDLGSFVVRAAKNFTLRWEEATTLTATMPISEGQWIIWGDTLYRALSNIIVGDQYVIDSNIERITVEEIKNEIMSYIDNLYNEISDRVGDLSDLNTPDTTSIVNAINSGYEEISDRVGNLSDLNTPDTTSIVNSINSVNHRIVGKIIDMTAVGLPTDGITDCASIFTDIITNDPTKIYYIPKGYYVFDNAPTLGTYGNIVTLIIDNAATNNYAVSPSAPFYANWSFIDTSKVNVIYNSEHSLTIGGSNYIEYEQISNGAKAAYATITSVSPIGYIGIIGGSNSKNLNGAGGYPIGVMAMVNADDPSNTNTPSVGGFYSEVYRSSGTTGASIGIELDHKLDVSAQNITPLNGPVPANNFSSAIQLSNGMTESGHEALSCGIYFNNNGATFNKGIVFKNDSITQTIIGREAVVLPSDALIDWYDISNVNIPCVEMLGGVDGINRGMFTVALNDNGVYKPKHINVDTMIGELKCKCISVDSATYNSNSPFTIDLTSYIDSGYQLHSLLMLQYPSATPSDYNLVVNTISPSSNAIAGYNFGNTYTGDLNLIILEYHES